MTPNAIRYQPDLSGISATRLTGFFAGWSNAPTVETHLRILEGSAHVVLALDAGSDRVVGFINAISDGWYAAFIPLLEVLPAYRGRGIGTELVRRMLAELEGYYSIDLVCDADVVPFYERLGLTAIPGMALRNYARQRRGVAE
jgi:ribosomal protein S18 acetylase RimI-like enzyme